MLSHISRHTRPFLFRSGGIKTTCMINGRKFSSNLPEEQLLAGSGIENVTHTSIKPYFDYKYIKSNATTIKENMSARNYSGVDVDHIVTLIDRRGELLDMIGSIRLCRNIIASRMKNMSSKNSKNQTTDVDQVEESIAYIYGMDAPALIEEGKRLKEILPPLEDELTQVETDLEHLAFKLPNDTSSKSPIGDESQFTLLHTSNPTLGSTQHFKSQGFIPKDHLDMGIDLGIIDLATASKVSGPRFYYLLKEAALLELALINYTLQKLVTKGFVPVLPPDVARNSIIEGAGFQSRDQRGLDKHIYSLSNTDMSLCGTAEIPMAGRYVNTITPEKSLPIRTVAYNHCFRTEIGGPGQQSRGIYRVHQFSKVEMFVVCTPTQADELHEEIINIEREIFEELGLHFRMMEMPTEDLGAPAYRKVDIEASMPGRAVHKAKTTEITNATDVFAAQYFDTSNTLGPSKSKNKSFSKKEHNNIFAKELQVIIDDIKQKYESVDTLDTIPDFYGEISSASNCTDYQARRLNIKYKPDTHDDSTSTNQFAYTLNGTACAVPRMIVAIMEQYQTQDGGFEIPTVLKPFMMGQSKIPFISTPNSSVSSMKDKHV